jgi:hypothetical protein
MSLSTTVQNCGGQSQACGQQGLRLGMVLIVTTAILFYGAIGALVWHFI